MGRLWPRQWLSFAAITVAVIVLDQVHRSGCQLITPPPIPNLVPVCEPLKEITLCMGIYDNASFPNVRDHQTQAIANDELEQFIPLIQGGCSNAIVHFLCAVYAPFCQYNRPEIEITPCRELCQYVYDGCVQPLLDFGISWPPHLNCDLYQPNDTSEIDFCPTNLRTLKVPNIIVQTPRPLSTTESPLASAVPAIPSAACPVSLLVTSHLSNRSYVFGGINNCGINCTGLFFSPIERNIVAPVFILLFAVICVLFTLFTVATFLIDRRRFHYPERPIIFISFCYLVVSVVYVVGSISKLAGQQNQAFSCSDEIGISSNRLSSSFVFQRLPSSESTYKTASCVILFVVVYFFQMASALWWVILTLTWFFAAALKWGEEAVEKMWVLYHVISWGLPSIQVILVLALRLVDGDQLSGLCYVGNADNIGLGVFVFLPLLVYLLIGVIFVVIGFTALVNIRKQLERDVTKSRKIGRLILRVGIYSTLYVTPNVILLLLIVYELAQKSAWEKAYVDECSTDMTADCRGNPEPSFTAYLLKYIMLFLVGVFSTTWILSSKTFAAWNKLFCSCCATETPSNGFGLTSSTTTKPHIYDVPNKMPQYSMSAPQHPYDMPTSSHFMMSSEKRDLSMPHPNTAV